MQRIDNSSAARFVSFFIERVARELALVSKPTWSTDGVINEYINDAEAIHNGKRKLVPSLEGFEYINIEGQEFEAFTTSGGLGTLCDTFEGKVDTLNYKTIRYPGHGKLMRFLMYELILKNDKDQLERILSNAKPPVEEDVVHVYAVVAGRPHTAPMRAPGSLRTFTSPPM